jgi:hypothetical protein
MLKLFLYTIKHDGFIAAESEQDAQEYLRRYKNDSRAMLSDPESFTSIVGPLTNVTPEWEYCIPWGSQNKEGKTCKQILDGQ